MLEKIIEYAKEHHASDIHLTYGLPSMIRIGGQLVPYNDNSHTDESILSYIKVVLSETEIAKIMAGKDVDLAFKSNDGSRLRANIFHQKKHLAVALRLLRDSIPTLEELKLPEILGKVASLRNGLVLVTGPTGSGKSTTLAAMINLINQQRKAHILTLEDPIEYEHQHGLSMINQREIGRDVEDYKTALKSALREDPDVILVGEMRDYETISLALSAAETGHLVFSTLHTSSAAKTINRIIDVFPPNQQPQIRAQLSTSLRAVIAQQLVPCINGVNRRAALEILLNNEAVGNMIREGKIFQIDSVIQTNAREGMQTLDMSLATLVQNQEISMEVAISLADNPNYVQKMAKTPSY